jgi:signal transduction histidine kinase
MGVRAVGGVRGVRDGAAREWCRRAMAAHRVVACVAASAALYACGVTVAITRQPDALSPAGLTIATLVYVSFAVIPIMRWPPWLPAAVATAGAVASTAAGTPDLLLGPALVVGMFVFSLRSEKTPVIAGTAAVIGVLLAGHLAFSLHAKTGWSDLWVVPWAAVAAAIGQAVRATRAHQVMLEERARRAEEGREYEARRRVQQERLRIARELHDAVGHHVALISVQAGAMSYLLDTDPAKARESLTHIQQASEAALEELRLTVGLLRQPGDHEPVEPAGGLGRLDELIASFTATGLQVTCDVTGQVRQLPEAVDLTAYRLIQESLTNTAKHAAGTSASIQLAFRPGALELAVEDDGPPAGGSRAGLEAGDEGHGIIGMRERAAALGGWLSAGPRAAGGFRVLAELPAPPPPAPAVPSRGGRPGGSGGMESPRGPAQSSPQARTAP